MSSVEQVTLPYVAPWQAGFTRYGTQILNPTIAANVASITIPDGQYWRVIYWQEEWITSATVGNRVVTLLFQQNNKTIYQTNGNGVITASTDWLFSFEAGEQAWNTQPAGLRNFGETPIPNILWAPGTKIQSSFTPLLGADSRSGTVVMAAEIYTLSDPEQPPQLRPTPVIG